MTVDTSSDLPAAAPPLEDIVGDGGCKGHQGRCKCSGFRPIGLLGEPYHHHHPPLSGDTSSSSFHLSTSSTTFAPSSSLCHRSHQSSSSSFSSTTATSQATTSSRRSARNWGIHKQSSPSLSTFSSSEPDSRPSPQCSLPKAASHPLSSPAAAQQYHNLSPPNHFWSQYSSPPTPSNTSIDISSSSSSCGAAIKQSCSSDSDSVIRWPSPLSLTGIANFCFLFFFAFSLLLLQGAEAHWQENIAPRRRIHLRDSDVDIFTGNDSAIDYFKYLDRDGDSLLVGARNVVYNISLSTLKENRRLDWSSSEDDTRMCKYKGKSEEVCQNYIKVLAKLGDERLLVCGTNAFKPKCRTYQYGPMHNYLVHGEKSGEALCPYDPTYPSTATFYGSIRERTEKNLYVATVAGFTGADPLIYREPLRTEQFNPKHLNAPSFVSSFPHSSHVYFFFRESAVEYSSCGKATFSRVARVCARDNGGPHKFRARWTSFSKARLQCAIGSNDEFPFYFNEIQATSEIIKGNYGGRNEQLIYAVFTTAPNSIGGSAVCAFRMEDIEAAFRGPFKGQKDIDSNWMAVPNARVPSPRPGECSNDSQSLPEMTVNFVKEHPLMDHPVAPAFGGGPLLVHTSLRARFTAVAVDPQIETATGKAYDVLFIGTDNGRVLKAINAASNAVVPPAAGSQQMHGAVAPVIIEEMVIFADGAPVTQILVHHTYYDAKLVVISPDSIRSVRLHHCKAKTCGECVRLQDPYCSFDLQQQKCTSSRSRYWNRDNYVQNIEQGWDPRCPDGRPEAGSGGNAPPELGGNLYNEAAEDYANGGGGANGGLDASVSDPSRSSDAGGSASGGGPSAVPIYSSETFALAVVTSVVTSLVFGFIIGYIFSRRCRKEDPGICSPYDDPHSYLDPHSAHHFANSLGINGGGLGGPTLTRLVGGGVGGGHHGPPSMGALYGSHGPLDHHAYSAGSGGGGGGTLGHGAGPHGGGGVLVGGKPINLVLNVPPKNSSKNANSSADNKPMANHFGSPLMTPMRQTQNMMTLNNNSNNNHNNNNPRYGPLPSLAAMQAMTHSGSAPLHRRLRTNAHPPPAYSDLDEFDCESEGGGNGGNGSGEPRYQPMPLHSLISRRPLPSQPLGSAPARRGSGGSQRSGLTTSSTAARAGNVPELIPPTTGSSSPSTEEEGDYEDISQL